MTSVTQTKTIEDPPKRTSRKRTVSSVAGMKPSDTETIDRSSRPVLPAFSDLIAKITEAKDEFEKLQKQISETREVWVKEQKDCDVTLKERNEQEEINRRRNEETYRYETELMHKRETDEFTEKKARFERELEIKKEELTKEKEELSFLRKQAGEFDAEKEKAVKEALAISQKDLLRNFETERKMADQERKAEKEILVLKITSLTEEKIRQEREIESLKIALEEATRQVKDIAVRVIESNSVSSKSANTSQEL